MENVTDELISRLLQKQERIRNEAWEKARACREDYLGVVTAGARVSAPRWENYIRHIPEGKARLFGYERKTDGKTAALINGFNAHCLELDDGHRFAMMHLGAAVLSALEAAADECGIPEDRILKGMIMGYEAACRVALAMQPSHKKKGYHTAGTCGTVGAALGVAFALGADGKQLKRILSLACGGAAGMLEMQEQGSELKPYNLGRAAANGLAAAYMGLYTDFESPEDILGGDRGFFRMFSEEWSREKLLAEQQYFEIERVYLKPYASCRHSHAAVEAAIRLREEVKGQEIERVTVRTYELGVRGHDHTEIRGTASAKLSTPYAVSAGLLYGRADLSVFDPVDPVLLRMAKKVRVAADEELTGLSSGKRAAIVEVYLKGGGMKSCRVDYAKGEPENPMTREELARKKEQLASYARPEKDGGVTG